MSVSNIFRGPGNISLDLARMIGASAAVTYPFPFIWDVIKHGHVPDPSSFGTGYAAVLIAVGGAPRVARCYRGRDVVAWLAEMGYYDKGIDEFPDAVGVRFRANHYVTGRDGGRDIDLRALARKLPDFDPAGGEGSAGEIEALRAMWHWGV